MKIPYRLRRTSIVHPAHALLIPGRDAAALLRLCATLRLDAPRVFVVADGFLLEMPRTFDKPVAGAIRLRELAQNLFLAIDAELSPALLADEAQVLGRNRGLVFLPGGRVLEFNSGDPIKLDSLIGLDRLRRGRWQALPPAPALASRIREIIDHRPADSPDAIIEGGGAGVAAEDPRPADAALPGRMMGGAAMKMGGALRWLGGALRLHWLASLGGAMMAGGLALAPRLSEKIMGQHAARLRELLEDFRNGNIERALRRALPLGQESNSGAFSSGAQLPSHDLGYSLENVLGDWGPASLWYTPDQLFRELQREYRRQAELAVQRGDYRRAAFIYGKLLGDFPMAAATLAQGGLHHDAAIVYLKRVHDYYAAAREFEAAGEFDQALDLYRLHHEHVRAADLLRRMGEEELALEEYQLAVDALVKNGLHFDAGELMLNRAERPDLAKDHFTAGWQARPGGDAVPCARRLATLHADGADADSLLGLMAEAQDYFQSPGDEALAGEFCNDVAHLAELPALATIREDLRDRCLMTLAHKLRQGWDNVGQLSSQLFSPASVWDTPLARDAHFASRIARDHRAPWVMNASARMIVIQSRIPIVRSLCQAPESGEIFLGFESGEIARFEPRTGEVRYLAKLDWPVYGLATDATASTLVCLSTTHDSAKHVLSCYSKWDRAETRVLENPGGYWLCPMLARTHDLVASLFDAAASEVCLLRLPRLLPQAAIRVEDCHPFNGFPITLRENRFRGGSATFNQASVLTAEYLLFDGKEMWHVANEHGATKSIRRFVCNIPATLASSSLDVTPLSLMSQGPGCLEIAGVGLGGVLTWAKIEHEPQSLANVTIRSHPGPCQAAALTRCGVIAAIAEDGIAWLRVDASGLKEQMRQRASFTDVIACFPSASTMELIVVSGNGAIACIRQAV